MRKKKKQSKNNKRKNKDQRRKGTIPKQINNRAIKEEHNNGRQGKS